MKLKWLSDMGNRLMIREKGRGKLSNGRTRSRPKSFKTKESAEDYAKSKGITVEKEFVYSETADRKIRKKFDEMIEYVKQNLSRKEGAGFPPPPEGGGLHARIFYD